MPSLQGPASTDEEHVATLDVSFEGSAIVRWYPVAPRVPRTPVPREPRVVESQILSSSTLLRPLSSVHVGEMSIDFDGAALIDRSHDYTRQIEEEDEMLLALLR